MEECIVIRTDTKLEPDATRVLIRPFVPNANRVVKILARIASQPDRDAEEYLNKIMADFANRHIEVENTFLERYNTIKHYQFTDLEPTYTRKLLIGSYFTSEYSLESAALFNPSMVPHPDQTGLSTGYTRFIMSLRAVGEGHISSVTFREGTIDTQCNVSVNQPTRFVDTPEHIVNSAFNKKVLHQKLVDMGFAGAYTQKVFSLLPEQFTIQDLEAAVGEVHQQYPEMLHTHKTDLRNLYWLARANYDIQFDAGVPLSGRVLFPHSPSEKNGIEDARFVRFIDENGEVTYYGTSTAWDGKTVLPQLIATKDFLTFGMRTLNGEVAKNKGMALFPRKINGKFAMISRQDNENIYIMFSNHLQFWRKSQVLVKPAYPWEYYQMGNCGAPLETEEGWILLTHGVGAMRRYAIGAVLLDKTDPTKVIGRTRYPILIPNENEREGYVPNVVYSCGAMIHNDKIVVPYAMADRASRIALVDIKALLAHMKGTDTRCD